MDREMTASPTILSFPSQVWHQSLQDRCPAAINWNEFRGGYHVHGSILVIEDDKDITDAMRDALSYMGYQVLVAGNGQEALDLLQKSEKPCMIFLDLMMPVMDGWEFRKIQQQNPLLKDIPVVVVSADGHAKKKAEMLQVQHALVKPIEFDDLVKVAQTYCS